MASSKLFLSFAVILIVLALAESYRISQIYDSYPWTNCNSFEATKKNCPRGEACLKLKSLKNRKYAWNYGMRCQSREEYIARVEYIYGLKK